MDLEAAKRWRRDSTEPPPPPPPPAAAAASSSSSSSSVLMEGLPDELALCVLARLPRALHAQVRLVCRAWNEALHPASGAISPLRKILSISEAWPLLRSFDGEWFLVDPLLQRFHRVPLLHSTMTPAGNELSIVATSVSSLPHYGMYWLDALGMHWHQAPPRPNTQLFVEEADYEENDFASAILDGYLYIAGGGDREGSIQSAERWFIGDSNTSSWECLPDMHHKRIWARGFAFQGCFCVVGGYEVSSVYEEQFPLHSGEMWDPRTKEWTLVPQLWPSNVFGDPDEAELAVVMGRLYALKHHTHEIMHFHDATQVWISVGRLPADGVDGFYRPCKLLGVGCELWLVLYTWDGHEETRFKPDVTVFTAVPTSSVSQLLSWESSHLIFEAGSKFLGTVVHV